MPTERTRILNATQVAQKIDRIAFEIFENHHLEEQFIVVGVSGNGQVLAGMIANKLRDISKKDVRLVELRVDKKDPLSSSAFVTIEKEDAEDRVVIVVDDVLNSGKTLIYGIRHLLQVRFKALRTAVLVDRDHKRFPVKADFVGLVLSTTLQEHVTVEFDGEMGVYLE
jgi:pyrimidine operon attenuation protein/uracil phosphoribosyltransferase